MVLGLVRFAGIEIKIGMAPGKVFHSFPNFSSVSIESSTSFFQPTEKLLALLVFFLVSGRSRYFCLAAMLNNITIRQWQRMERINNVSEDTSANRNGQLRHQHQHRHTHQPPSLIVHIGMQE